MHSPIPAFGLPGLLEFLVVFLVWFVLVGGWRGRS